MVSLLFAVLGTKASGEDTLTSANVETMSYDLYQKSDWKNLSVFCEKAISSGFDYFYLRMRAGISYYEQKQYRAAIPHFKKALEFDVTETAKEYLYFSYLFSGRPEEAHGLLKNSDSAFVEKVAGRKNSNLGFAFSEAGVKVPDNPLFQTANYASLGMSHYIGKNVSLLHVGTFFSQDESRFNLSQYQYYIRPSVVFGKGFKLSAGYQFSYNENSIPYSYISRIIEIPPPPPDPPGQGQPPPPPPSTVAPTYDTVYAVATRKNYLTVHVAAVTLTKHFSFFDVNAGGTFAELDTAKHYQLNAGAAVFPLRNDKFSIAFQAYAHSNRSPNFKNLALVPAVNFSPIKKSYISLSYFVNSGNNTIEQTGYMLNNSFDLTTSRTSVYIAYQVFKNIQLYVLYANESKREQTRKLDYKYNTLVAGIRLIP